MSAQLDTPCLDHGQAGHNEGYTYRRTKEHGRVLLHRLVFFEHNAYWPEVVMHRCDNPRCIEPTHLLGGTRDLNNKDRAAKGRSAKTRADRRKLTLDDARRIRERYSPTRCNVNGVMALAREYAVDTKAIYQIIKGQTYCE